jgi:hypothetical protein
VNPQRRLLLATCMAGTSAARAQTAPALATAPAEVAATLTAARLQGRARMRFLGMAIYEARLWTGAAAVPPAGDWSGVAFAIELNYARTLWGSMIAERSLTEMRRQGEIAPEVAERWLATMKTLFPDVKEGDRLTGVNTPGQGARFFLNGSPRGTPQDEAFSRVFFGIWLSPKTSEPALRSALLGQAS